MPAEGVLRGVGIELVDREVLLSLQQLELLRRHDQVQDALFCADRAVALEQPRQIGAHPEAHPAAMAAALVDLDHQSGSGTTRNRSVSPVSRPAAPLNHTRSSAIQASSIFAAQREISASAVSRAALSAAKSSISAALCLIATSGLGQLSKRDIHCRSPHKRWFRVPWIEPQKAPRGCRRSASERRAAAPYSRRFISAL